MIKGRNLKGDMIPHWIYRLLVKFCFIVHDLSRARCCMAERIAKLQYSSLYTSFISCLLPFSLSPFCFWKNEMCKSTSSKTGDDDEYCKNFPEFITNCGKIPPEKRTFSSYLLQIKSTPFIHSKGVINWCIYSLSPEGGQHQNSPCDINALYNRVVTRVKAMIKQGNSLIDAWTTSPDQFYRKRMGRTNDNLNVDIRAKRVNAFCRSMRRQWWMRDGEEREALGNWT